MELDYRAIGVRIRRLRKERGLTQQTLAEMSGQEPSNISHIERGATKLSLPTLVSVANALEVTVDQLLCDSLPASRSVFETEAAHILSDCSHLELKVITETIRTLKENLRRLKLSE
ncbi:MAG: helix-turn-helix transcriptional regulator [Oscillibacter sp.]|jgi:transcriptional regulator with XRE-family HTH domain|nr:helix-turn-helix transcriptional regulator [uncultured Oscillibacter sp.]MCI8970083.1 helix-turn-helix transcriptional regulator [Oscillibacter sp.]MCI9577516.1 helix-turn-helix transcriptional regulator [Oscillibacter sp.]